MSDPNAVTQAPPDAEAMQAIMAKIAKVQKILGFLACCQLLLGLFFLILPFLPAALGVSGHAFGFMLLAPFLLGLSYAAYLARKDLSFARVVFRNTAISQIGFLLIALYIYFTFPAALVLVLAAIALILGGLACMVIYQASKQ